MKIYLPYKVILFLFLFFYIRSFTYAQYVNDSIKTGSYIINMGIVPQSKNNALRPYGFIYELIRNRIIPVKWVINSSKIKDGNDFHHNGIFYKGGAFIIPKDFINSTIQSLITTWNGLGVVGAYTTYDTVLPVYATLTSWPRSVLDSDNGNIVKGFYDDASISSASYSFGLPSSLNVCNDLFVLPHADPTWATHGNIYNFVTTNKGYIWAACHAVSVLESIKDPSNTIQLNFLTNNGLQCYSSGKCNGIAQAHGGNATSPINFTSSFAMDPISQYIGDLVPATNNGSEEWFIPLTAGSGWHNGVKKIIQTSDGSTGKEGVKLVYGNAYNNANNGKVMYMGGHDQGGSGVSNIAAQRAFFNFVLLTGEEKKPKITLNGITDSMGGGNTRTLSATVTGGNPAYTYLWTASAGVISNPTSASTQYTSPAVSPGQTLNIVIRCQVTDGCGRWNFNYGSIKIVNSSILEDGFLEFNAVNNNTATLLNWKLSESNNVKEIQIERSINGSDFVIIDQVKTNLINGSYTDISLPSSTEVYYRIKAISLEKSTYSQIVKIQISKAEKITIYPNPSVSSIRISGLNTAKKIQLRIMDIKGTVLINKEISCASNNCVFNGLDILKPGIYILEIYQNGVCKREKLIIGVQF